MSHLSANTLRKKLLMPSHDDLPLWKKIIFPIWLWNSLMHDKHEAFAFKYDTKALQDIEKTIMPTIGPVLYINSVLYYFIMFFCPLYFVQECGYGLATPSHYIYILYAICNIIVESLIVFWIQTRISNKALLKFNKWHFIELVLGTISKFDTYLDVAFLSLTVACREWNLIIPISLFILMMIAYPAYRLTTLTKINTKLSHTLPYMERNC